jgi:catechol 2,3-dioxygenase-like lactoylglutathione lyase family enzyme
MPAKAAIESLSAVTLSVENMARACAFYDALGFRRLFGGPDSEFTSYAAGPNYLNIFVGAPAPGWGRAIFYVSDVDAFHGHCLAKGLAPDFPPSDAPWGERYFHITDPDGNEISFARPLTG